jgi:hypothetical protein
MGKKTRTQQAHELRVNAVAAVLLVRTFAPQLLRHVFESLELGERARARLPGRKRRTSRPLKIGVAAVGVAAAGVAAARLSGYQGPFGDGSDTDPA